MAEANSPGTQGGPKDLQELYNDVLKSHYRTPHNRELLPAADFKAQRSSRVCGAKITVYAELSPDGRLARVTFVGSGGAIFLASASLMTLAAENMTLDEALEYTEHLTRVLREGEEIRPLTTCPDLSALESVRAYPMRVTSALLPWDALREGIRLYRDKE